MPSLDTHRYRIPNRDLAKAAAIGILNAILLSAVMVPAFRAGLAPMPQQPSLAFAETLLHRRLPLPIGLLFHVAYVTFWSIAFVVFARERLTWRNALFLALGLWLVALLVFFPIIGWGVLGLALGPKVLVASLIPHLLFALFLWLGCRIVFAAPHTAERSD